MNGPGRTTFLRAAIRAVRFMGLVGLYGFVIAWPWLLFQQVAPLGTTLTKLFGLLIIGAGAVEVVRRRDFRRLRTGLEGPLLLLAVAFVQSAFHSLDPGATAYLLRVYATYILLFYATATLVRDDGSARRLSVAIVASCALVGALSIACAQGWLLPTAVGETMHLGTRRAPDARAGDFLRLVATSEDLNEGVLPLALAFPLLLAVVSGGRRRALRGGAAMGAGLLLGAGILIASSRSSVLALAIAGAVLAGEWLRRRAGRRTFVGLAAGVAALVVGAVLAERLGWLDPLFRGMGARDPSVESRAYVFRVAASILPEYVWWGTGLGASDAAIRAVADPERWAGVTLHSVPLKYLIETGVLGFVGYLWFWGAALWRLYRSLGFAGDSRPMAWAWLGTTLCAFLILAVQPFLVVSLLPLLLGIGAAIANRSKEVEPAPVGGLERAAALLACLVVIPGVFMNAAAYQETAEQRLRMARDLEAGCIYEERGEWDLAEAAYDAVLESGDQDERLYVDVADRVADFEHVYKAMALEPDLATPAAAARAGRARVLYGRGRFEEAAVEFSRLRRDLPESAATAYGLAESLWRAGRFAESIEAFAAAAELEGLPVNATWRARMAVIDERIDALIERASPEDRMEAAWLLRMRGRWEEALALARDAAREPGPAQGQALFFLGVDAERRSDIDEAERYYRTALEAAPDHWEAGRRLEALEAAPSR